MTQIAQMKTKNRRKDRESTDCTDSHRLNNASGGGAKIATCMEHGRPMRSKREIASPSWLAAI